MMDERRLHYLQAMGIKVWAMRVQCQMIGQGRTGAPLCLSEAHTQVEQQFLNNITRSFHLLNLTALHYQSCAMSKKTQTCPCRFQFEAQVSEHPPSLMIIFGATLATTLLKRPTVVGEVYQHPICPVFVFSELTLVMQQATLKKQLYEQLTTILCDKTD